MAIIVRCGCGAALSAEERLAGKFVRCPDCGERMQVPGDPVPEEEPDDRPKKKKKKRAASAGGSVADQYMREARQNLREEKEQKDRYRREAMKLNPLIICGGVGLVVSAVLGYLAVVYLQVLPIYPILLAAGCMGTMVKGMLGMGNDD